jgi:hypothetical protein
MIVHMFYMVRTCMYNIMLVLYIICVCVSTCGLIPGHSQAKMPSIAKAENGNKATVCVSVYLYVCPWSGLSRKYV